MDIQSYVDSKVKLGEYCGNNEYVPADWISPSYVNVTVVGIFEDSLQYSWVELTFPLYMRYNPQLCLA
jgi:hypothetical protein